LQKVSGLALVSSFNKGMSEKVLLKNPYMLKSIYKQYPVLDSWSKVYI